MVIVNKRKFILVLFIIFVILFVPQSHADEGVQVSEDVQTKGAGADPGGECKEQEVGSEDANRRAPPQEDKGREDSSKLDNSNPPAAPNVDEKIQIPKVEGEEQRPPEVVEPKQQSEKSEGSDPSGEPAEKKEETKSEDADRPSVAVDSKKLNAKEDENTHKINLNDVNAYSADDNHLNNMKRETRYSEFVGLPRDASYFFEDLEPFINNNSNNRINRAAPSKETKSQKSKFSGKGKESVDPDADDDDDDCGNEEEEEKSNEDEYDDDEDIDSDCQPTTNNECTTQPECTTTTTCPPPTTTCPPPTTTCPPPTTTKCTTHFECPTTCRTTHCPTKCPRICAKGS